MFFTPLIIYSLTGNQSPPEGALRHQARWEQPLQQGSSGGAAQRAGGSTPAAVAMWSSIPYLVTSLVHGKQSNTRLAHSVVRCTSLRCI